LAKPVLYWTPIIAPGNLIFYDGKMFPQWKGPALVSGLASATAPIALPGHVQMPILGMHIRPDQSAFVGCGRLQRYAGATALYFATPPTFVRCVMRVREGLPAARVLSGNIALNPYKLAICCAPLRD
jgi:hypothetical protein